MSFNVIKETLKYVDCFGTTFNFYIERNRKLYTSFGGILTLLSILFGCLVFIYINLDDFLHNNPNSTTSTEKENFKKIKFKDEKIWIPWRIRNFGGKTIDHTNLLYPIIYYYKGIRNSSLNSLDVSYDFIGYKLCNETSMVNNTDLFKIDIGLEQLYCIDMEELDMGGSWDADFLDLITFDIYTCKNGIDYNATNENCTTYDDLAKRAGENDCYEFEMYYPVVQYQPMNKTTPIFIRYYNYFYHFSRYSNKIDRLYLQQHILKDDIGWYKKNEITYSHWGTVSLNGDSYATGSKRDLMNEGSTSRLYSFNIYLKSDVIYYNRSYKKIWLIIADGLPVVNVVFIIFRLVAKVLKVSAGNRKMTELLFENLKKQKIKIHNEHFNSIKIDQNKINDVKEIKNIKLNKKRVSASNLSKNFNNNLSAKNMNDVSSFELNHRESGKKLASKNYKERDSIIFKDRNKANLNLSGKSNSIYKNALNNHPINIDQNNGIDKQLSNIKEIFSLKSDDISSNLRLSNKNKKSEEDKMMPDMKPGYVKKTLFPYRYYLFSIFIKNINLSKSSFFFTKKFIAVYYFICQLFDISSYLILQKEFEIMKNNILMEKYREILENRQKINVNDVYFNVNMKQCLDSKKFSILGRLK